MGEDARMKPEDIRRGGFYVSTTGWLVREIIDELGEDVCWRDYALSDGKPMATGAHLCSRRALARWAGRMATPEEAARMQVGRALAAEMARNAARIQAALGAASDAQILEEVHRRGLDARKQGCT
jgi:hypothetical protein